MKCPYCKQYFDELSCVVVTMHTYRSRLIKNSESVIMNTDPFPVEISPKRASWNCPYCNQILTTDVNQARDIPAFDYFESLKEA